MTYQTNTNQKKDGKHERVPTVSAVLDDGTIVETVYDPLAKRTAFVIYRDGDWSTTESLTLGTQTLVPYSANNNLLKHEVVLLPTGPEEYGTEEELVREIQDFIHAYVDVSPLFEQVASYYVLLSWVYDSFNELPYLRLRGDPGSGKTRFLLTVGSLCYKPIFASGASTVSPLFRILDAFRGTLIIDEGDFRLSDERAEIVKILNNGNARGFPVLRSEVTNKREFDPRAYAVFGPKLVATRGYFQDGALESRCITEEMGQQSLRDDVPINLPASHKDEALSLRNKLLTFRFRSLGKQAVSEALVDRKIEPRINQVFAPLLSVIQDERVRADLRSLARSYNREMTLERGMKTEAQVLEVIRDLVASGERLPTIKQIADWFIDRFGEDYERKVTPKWIGTIVRRRLALRTQKTRGVFALADGETAKLHRLYDRYGVNGTAGDEEATGSEEVVGDAR